MKFRYILAIFFLAVGSGSACVPQRPPARQPDDRPSRRQITTTIGKLLCFPLAVNNNSRVLLECAEPDGPVRFAVWDPSSGAHVVELAPEYRKLEVFRATGFSDDDTIVGQLEKPFPPPSNAWYPVGFISGGRTLPPNFVPTDISSDGTVISGYQIDRHGSSISPPTVTLLKGGALVPAPSSPKLKSALFSERVNNSGAVVGQTDVPSKLPQAETIAFSTVGGALQLLYPLYNSPLVAVRSYITEQSLHGNGFQLNNTGDIVFPYQLGHYDPTVVGELVIDRVGSVRVRPDGSRSDVVTKDGAFGATIKALNDQGVMVGTEYHHDGSSTDFIVRADGSFVYLKDLFHDEADLEHAVIAGINNRNEIVVTRRFTGEADGVEAFLRPLP